MGRFWQLIAGVLLAVILGLVVAKHSKDISLALISAVCVMVLLGMIPYLEPVLDFIRQLQEVGQLDGTMTGILLKAVGVGMVTEVAVLICNDSGNASLGKALQILSTVVVLWLSLPLMRSLVETIQKIMGEL